MPQPTDDADILDRLVGTGWRTGRPERSVSRLSAYGLIRRAGRLLLVRVAPGYEDGGSWTLPGGGLDFGESPEAAVVREVEEETGLIAKVTGPPAVLSDTGTWPIATPPLPFHLVRFVFPMTVIGGEDRAEVDGSTDAVEWFSDADLATIPVADVVAAALSAARELRSEREQG